MAIEIKENLPKENLIIGVVGPIGVGKSTISRILGERLGASVVEENFGRNPFLERFYDDPKLWSYKSQTWFFAEKVKQLRSLDFSKSQIIDPALEMDFIYAQTLHRIGFMETPEFNLYKTAFEDIYNLLQKEKGVRKPDIFLVLNAPIKVLEKRIRERGHPYEIKMLEEYPSYLMTLKTSTAVFSGNKNIFIDTRSDEYTEETQIDNLVEKINSKL